MNNNNNDSDINVDGDPTSTTYSCDSLARSGACFLRLGDYNDDDDDDKQADRQLD